MAYVEANLSTRLCLSDLAGAAQLSTYHFAHTFRSTMQVAPMRYVWQRRIERAKRDLAGTDEPIVMVAIDCGFSSQSHFTTAFRQATGITPAAYRSVFRMLVLAGLFDWLDIIEFGFPW